MRIITFSGVDGSGKSTQLELLRSKLVADGKKVAYFHAIEFSLANRLARLWRKQSAAFVPGQEKAIVKSSPFGTHIRYQLLSIDLARFRFFLWKLKRSHLDYLLSDRYFYDSLIQLEFLRRQSGHSFWFLFWNLRRRLLLFSIPKPDQAFYLEVSPHIIMERSRVPEQGLAYLETKQALFKEYAPLWHIQTIDAHGTPQEVATAIQNALHL